MSKEKETPEANIFSGFKILESDILSATSNKTPEDATEEVENEESVETPEEAKATKKVEPAKKEPVKKGDPKAGTDFDKLDKDKQDLIDRKLGLKKDDKTTPEKEETSEEDTPEDKNTGFFKTLVTDLADKGVLDFKAESIEGDDDSEDILHNAVNQTVQKEVSAWKESYPDDVKKFLKYVEDGGNPRQFLDIYYNKNSWEGFKIDTPERQKATIEQSLIYAGWTPEEITDELKDYEDMGKLEAKAKVHLPKLQQLEKSQKEHLVKAQEANRAEQEQNAQKYWTELKTDLEKREDIQGFKLTPALKTKIWDHMSKPIDKEGRTKLQANNDTNKDAQFLYAYLDYLNWDISKLERKAESKVASKLKEKLDKFTDSREKLKSGRREEIRSDDQDIDENFSGFGSIA
jgi:hypothetical protein